MSDATAAVVETPSKTGELRAEMPNKSVETAVETGDTSGVYRIARDQVDETVTREMGISKLDDPNAAMVAGPEIVALKQADAEFQQRVEGALGGLKTTLDGVAKPVAAAKIETPVSETAAEKDARLEAVALEAMKAGPLTVEEMAADLEKHEAEEKQAEMAKVTPQEAAEAIPLVTKKEETASVAILDKDIARGVNEFEQGLEKINAELAAEKKALEDFNSTHGQAHTPLEQAYLDALNGRVAALEFEKKAHETSDKSYETTAKLVELKQKADKAEAAYQVMYDGQVNQPPVATEGLHLNEEDEDYEARQYEQFHPGSSFGQSQEVAPQAKPRPVMEASPMGTAPKPKGRVGKFIDGLKFWKYFGKNQPS
jgi:hypothetical protein